ncbi:MAG: hypothetical protein JRJ24_12130 [Deltaproteobacteria bacterium]|nr:hypothetical protein [Deltaproteobacteria bacterium]
MSSRTPSNDERRAEWWKLISLTRPRDAFPHFLASRAEIEALLRAGHTMHRVWEAYRQASPPFPATYETFRTYCVRPPTLRSHHQAPRRLPRMPGPPQRSGHAFRANRESSSLAARTTDDQELAHLCPGRPLHVASPV